MTIDDLFTKIKNDFIYTDSDILLTSLLIVFFLSILLISNFLIIYINKRKIIEKSRETFRKKIRELDLTINEIDLINKLAVFLKQPWKKYLLLTNYQTFSKCRSRFSLEIENNNKYVETLENKILKSTKDFDIKNIMSSWNDFDVSVKNSLDEESEFDKKFQDVYIKKEHSKKDPHKADIILLDNKKIIIKNNINLKINDDVRIFIHLKGEKIIRINGEVTSISKISKRIVIVFNHIS